jgi:hypothetical protein
MQLLGIDWHVWLIIAIMWVGSIIYVRRKREASQLWDKLFQTNQDLDSTLSLMLKGVITISMLLIFVVYFIVFHDDLDKGNVGMLGSQIAGNVALVLNNIMGDKKPNKEKE